MAQCFLQGKNSMNMPLITIGICCYNGEDTIARAIDSALAQNWPNFELIIVDDGSKDRSVEIIREKISNYSNAHLIVHEINKTFPGALNTMIRNAQGEFIAIFDDDDESRPDRIAAQYKTIIDYEQKTGAKLVACWASGVRRYPNGYELKLEAIGSKPRNPVGTETADFLLYFGRKPGVFYGSGTPSCSLMTRKSTYETIGLYDESMFRSEDSDFSIRLGKHGGHFIGTPEPLLVQYSTGGGEKAPQRNYDSYKILMNKHRDHLDRQGHFQYAMMWNKLRFHHFSKHRFRSVLQLILLFCRHPILTWKHVWASAPRRLVHEWKMGRKAS
jgi:glycosyltransferase involved in cell wall biosynthesis